MPRVSATMRSRTRGSSRPEHDGVQQLAGIGVGQPADDEFGQPGEGTGPAPAYGEHQRDRLRHQSSGDEAERLHRHLVEPLRVVDHAEQGLVVGGGGHQAQRGQPDQEAVRGLPDAPAEGHVQRLALWFR